MSNLIWLEKLEDIRNLVEDGDHSFTAWEIEFVDDLYERWEDDEEWEPNYKQEAKIDEIWGKCQDE